MKKGISLHVINFSPQPFKQHTRRCTAFGLQHQTRHVGSKQLFGREMIKILLKDNIQQILTSPIWQLQISAQMQGCNVQQPIRCLFVPANAHPSDSNASRCFAEDPRQRGVECEVAHSCNTFNKL